MTAVVPVPVVLEPTPEVIGILEEFLAGLEVGARPNPEELVARCPEMAEPLKACLASLEFLQDAALSLRGSGRPEQPAALENLSELGPLGDFRLVREVGRGGMGVVYEAEQISLGRRVALKVLPFAAALDARQLQRFKNEAQAAASLHHTNIVPVFGVGCEGGTHYYAMQYIEGQTLAEIIGNLRGGNACWPGRFHLGTERSPCRGILRYATQGGAFRRRESQALPRGGDAGYAGRRGAGTCSSARRGASGYQAGQPARRIDFSLRARGNRSRGGRGPLMGHGLRPGSLPPWAGRADRHRRPRGHAAAT